MFNNAPTQPVNFRFNNGVPNEITLLATPFSAEFSADSDSGLYAQDKWTIDRLTLSYGVRYDYFKTSFPEQRLEPGLLVPTRNITFPAARGEVSYFRRWFGNFVVTDNRAVASTDYNPYILK